ncbi:hypothetical protein ACIRD3_39710 [Kitasatospora sp. NPDC093550]|uniref:hypothetical protein n=1 Tax=Kitasatospora sp. NPDC093550 TaxID=3364089 RepID=UPI00380B4D87
MTKNNAPYAAARQAAEAIRQLNHDTLNASEMTAPEISSAVRALMEMVDRLPQTFEQLIHHLEKQQQAGAVRMEDGRDPAEPVTKVVTALREAVGITEPPNRDEWGTPGGPLSLALAEAGGWLYNMGAVSTPDDDDAETEA